MSETASSVGLLGLGAMGSAAADCLLERGLPGALRAFNRSPVAPEPGTGLKAGDEPCSEGGGAANRAHHSIARRSLQMTSSSDDLFARSDVVVSFLADDGAYRSTLFLEDVLRPAVRGVPHLVMATLSVGFVGELGDIYREADTELLVAPVFGRPEAARTGQLIAIAGAPEDEISPDFVPLLEALCARVLPADDPGRAAAFKLAGNLLLCAAVGALAEATGLVTASGLDPEAWLAFVSHTLFPGPVYRGYGERMLGPEPVPPGFPLRHGAKDMSLVLEAAAELGLTLPIATRLKERLAELRADGLGARDLSAIRYGSGLGEGA